LWQAEEAGLGHLAAKRIQDDLPVASPIDQPFWGFPVVMSGQDDRTLVRECLNGDTRSFELLIDQYQKVLFNVALRMLNNREDAMDVTQTCFIKAYEKLETYDPKYKFFSWIYKIMVNESLNLINRRKSFEEVDRNLSSQGKTPAEDYEETWLAERVQSAIIKLPMDYRRVIVLRHFGNLSYKEMSGALDVPEKTVKSRLYTARRLLRDLLVSRGVVQA
jgi:RNA polymerase sigma-70 factor (ECF subfamily)